MQDQVNTGVSRLTKEQREAIHNLSGEKGKIYDKFAKLIKKAKTANEIQQLMNECSLLVESVHSEFMMSELGQLNDNLKVAQSEVMAYRTAHEHSQAVVRELKALLVDVIKK